MIKSFRHKGLKKLFYDGKKKGVRAEHVDKLIDILDRLDAAAIVNDMNYPGSKLHPLKRDLKDHWSVTVSGNWRVIFRFKDGDAYVADYKDYH